MRKRILMIVGVSVLALLALWSFRWAVVDLSGMCSNDEVREVRGSGDYRAVIYTRSCGATTGWGTNVSLLGESVVEHPFGSGNVFRADWHGDERPAHYGSGPPVRVEWLAPDRLRITYDDRADLFFQQTPVSGVDIEYRTARLPLGTEPQR